MKATVHKASHYVVKNGKLVLKSETQEQKPNYRYVHHTYLNRPTQQDYFRATIDELIAENQQLKKIINQKDEEITLHKTQRIPAQVEKEINVLKSELATMQGKYHLGQAQLQQQKALVKMRDAQINDLRSENDMLRQVIWNLRDQLEVLKERLQYSQREVQRINQVLQFYSENVIARIADVEHLLTQSINENPVVENPQRYDPDDCIREQPYQQNNLEEDQFYTVKSKSIDEDYGDRFMTPKPKGSCQLHDLEAESPVTKKCYTPQSRIQQVYTSHQKLKNSLTPDTKSQDNHSSSCGSQLSQNLRTWSAWTGNKKISTLSFLDEVDPITGSLTPFFGSK